MPVMDKRVLILSLSSIVVLKIKQIIPRRFSFVMLFLQTVLNYQNFMYPNISPCPAFFVTFKDCCDFCIVEIVPTHSKGKQEQRS